MILVIVVIAAFLIVATIVAVVKQNHASGVSAKASLQTTLIDPWLAARRDDVWEVLLLQDNGDYEMLFPQEEIPQWTV